MDYQEGSVIGMPNSTGNITIVARAEVQLPEKGYQTPAEGSLIHEKIDKFLVNCREDISIPEWFAVNRKRTL